MVFQLLWASNTSPTAPFHLIPPPSQCHFQPSCHTVQRLINFDCRLNEIKRYIYVN